MVVCVLLQSRHIEVAIFCLQPEERKYHMVQKNYDLKLDISYLDDKNDHHKLDISNLDDQK